MNIKKVAVLGAAAGMLIAAFGIETPLVKILTFGSVNLALAYSFNIIISNLLSSYSVKTYLLLFHHLHQYFLKL